MAHGLTHSPRLYVEVCALATLAIAARLVGVGVGHLPVGDEMFHILAAQSWAADGTFSIADGSYERASLFTATVGLLFRHLGESLVVARLPALVFGVVWVVVLFIWVRTHAGRLAAWITGGTLALAPHAIELSLYSRMYTVHGTFFLLGTMAVYSLLHTEHRAGSRLALGVAAAVCFALALHLQDITLIGLCGVGVAVILALLVKPNQTVGFERVLRLSAVWHLPLLIAVLAAAATLFMVKGDLLAELWATLVTPAYANLKHDWLYYVSKFSSEFTLLWWASPLLLIAAMRRQPQLALFCSAIFLTVLVIHSLAGRKAERYIYYGLPYLFVVWGISVSVVWPHVEQVASSIARQLSERLPRLRSFGAFDPIDPLVKAGLICLLLIPLLVTSQAPARTANLLNGKSYYFGVTLSNWEVAHDELEPLISSAGVVVTTNFPKTLYYFGRYDVAFSKVIVHDIVDSEEGGTDPRTGKPAISEADALHAMITSGAGGVFVGELPEWRNRFKLNDEAANILEEHATRVALPPESRLFAYTW